MAVTITLPDDLQARLQANAEAQRRTVEELALDILARAVNEEAVPTPEEVVARIQAAPRNPSSVRPATGSLAEALRDAPSVSDFDLAAWQRGWAEAEAEMKAVTSANRRAEVRE